MDSGAVSNKSLQEEEIQAMFSIYESEWQVEDPLKNNSYSIKISNSSGNSVFFKVILPEDYPLNSAPQYLISAPWMSREVKSRLTAMLEDIYSENIGSCVLYQWVLRIQDFINGELTKDDSCDYSEDLASCDYSEDLASCDYSEDLARCDYSEDLASYDYSKDLASCEATNAYNVPLNSACKSLENVHLKSNDEEFPPIAHGEIIQDKKSVFQGHAATAVSVDQVKKILSKLKENRKIAIATHNILAYRISIGPNSFIQDYDDDGENRAGNILLDLLKKLDVKDVVVIVSRWYGGIHLGPDRFKDIKYAARNALIAAGILQEKAKGSEKKP